MGWKVLAFPSCGACGLLLPVLPYGRRLLEDYHFCRVVQERGQDKTSRSSSAALLVVFVTERQRLTWVQTQPGRWLNDDVLRVIMMRLGIAWSARTAWLTLVAGLGSDLAPGKTRAGHSSLPKPFLAAAWSSRHLQPAKEAKLSSHGHRQKQPCVVHEQWRPQRVHTSSIFEDSLYVAPR